MQEIFEKFTSFIFLLLLVGMVGFLTFVPLPGASEKVILMIIGGLMTTAAVALPKMFGTEDKEKEALKDRVKVLEQDVVVVGARYDVLQNHYDTMINLLVDRHIVNGEGIKQV